MDERTIAIVVAALIVGIVIGRVSARRRDERIVWQEPVDTSHAAPDVKALVRDGKYIEAIKRHREITGTDLKSAKDYVDALKRELEAIPPG